MHVSIRLIPWHSKAMSLGAKDGGGGIERVGMALIALAPYDLRLVMAAPVAPGRSASTPLPFVKEASSAL